MDNIIINTDESYHYNQNVSNTSKGNETDEKWHNHISLHSKYTDSISTDNTSQLGSEETDSETKEKIQNFINISNKINNNDTIKMLETSPVCWTVPKEFEFCLVDDAFHDIAYDSE